MDDLNILGTGPLDLEAASRILNSAQIPAEPLALIPLAGGANNRVLRLDLERAPSLILKSYFQHPKDPRPRLKAEFEFLSFAWKQGIRSIPQPLYQDPNQNLALYTYIDASLATSLHSNPSFVIAAAAFLQELNREKSKGRHLLHASEACYNVSDYLETVERKLGRLLASSQKDPLEQQLHQFLQYQLLPRWTQIQENTCKTALHTLNPESSDLIITPSDFGLHNVLVSSTDEYSFIDFEYAGWDDPVKTICDFFLQPKIPISFTYFEFFSKSIASLAKNKEKTLERTRQMLPICKIKWCCIILNVFLQTEKARREFAKIDLARSQERQLQLVNDYLAVPLPF